MARALALALEGAAMAGEIELELGRVHVAMALQMTLPLNCYLPRNSGEFTVYQGTTSM
jgi:hypothetical protein